MFIYMEIDKTYKISKKYIPYSKFIKLKKYISLHTAMFIVILKLLKFDGNYHKHIYPTKKN